MGGLLIAWIVYKVRKPVEGELRRLQVRYRSCDLPSLQHTNHTGLSSTTYCLAALWSALLGPQGFTRLTMVECCLPVKLRTKSWFSKTLKLVVDKFAQGHDALDIIT